MDKIFSNWLDLTDRKLPRQEGCESESAKIATGMARIWLQSPLDKKLPLPDGLTARKFRHRHTSLTYDNINFQPLGFSKKESNGVENASIIDFNAGGYCIEWQSGDGMIFPIHELILLQDPADEHPKLVQAVWLKRYKNQRIRIGAKLISDSVMPVSVSVLPADGKDEQLPARIGILVINDINGGISHELIVQGSDFDIRQIIRLQTGADLHYAQLQDFVSPSHLYQHFNLAFYDGDFLEKGG
jgi:hypothetical protein